MKRNLFIHCGDPDCDGVCDAWEAEQYINELEDENEKLKTDLLAWRLWHRDKPPMRSALAEGDQAS